jgi:uncharacterized protein
VSLEVLDWRRRVARIYAEVRAENDPRRAHELWRSERDELFARHTASPLLPEDRAAFHGLRTFAYDPALRFVAEVDADVETELREVLTATDGVVPLRRIGVVRLPDLGSLDVWWLESYGGGVFVPVKDALAGRETYGGGRYLVDTVKGADLGGDIDPSTGDGTLVVDLNFAYNPSCAYDPAWACPLAGAGNTLPVEVRAGEAAYA